MQKIHLCNPVILIPIRHGFFTYSTDSLAVKLIAFLLTLTAWGTKDIYEFEMVFICTVAFVKNFAIKRKPRPVTQTSKAAFCCSFWAVNNWFYFLLILLLLLKI